MKTDTQTLAQGEIKRVNVGDRFGRLTVVGKTGGPKNTLVLCDCGTAKAVYASNLRRGRTTSCGCLHRDQLAQANRTHGRSQSREYSSWMMMKQRCSNPNFESFRNYGAKGISVCQEWFDSFEQFFTDMGPRPANTSLDRFPDRAGNYCATNCRWATRAEQRQNSDSTTLTAETVRLIRASGKNCNQLANALRVEPSCVYRAKAGKTWANISEVIA